MVYSILLVGAGFFGFDFEAVGGIEPSDMSGCVVVVTYQADVDTLEWAIRGFFGLDRVTPAFDFVEQAIKSDDTGVDHGVIAERCRDRCRRGGGFWIFWRRLRRWRWLRADCKEMLSGMFSSSAIMPAAALKFMKNWCLVPSRSSS